jgi:malonyl CoA-acyl carrier protein transacylase
LSGIAILCSGQGLQGSGMFDLLADAPEAAPVFAAASEVLAGRDPRHIVREGNDTELHKDKTAQILCCTEALAAWAVLAGSVQRRLVVAGHGAQHMTRLPVTVPAHTPLLRCASEAFRGVLHDRVAHVGLPDGLRVLSGIDGNAVFSTAGLDKLADQIAQTVDWAACMETCREAGITKAVELGPGSALARMMRDAAPEVDAHSVAEFDSLDGLKRWIGRTE